jgi:predicted Zn-dependent peptidase
MSNVRKEVLPNGLTILTEPMSSVRSVSVGIWLRTGARQETLADNGIAHFIEHMLFKGTTSRSAEDIARAADSIGGHLDAFTAKETTSYSIKVLDENLPQAFSILSDLVKNPLFKPEHIKNESGVIQEEIKMVEDTPDDLVHELFTQTYWRGHALGRPILGTRSTVRSFDRKRLAAYFRRHYAPSNLLIAAAKVRRCPAAPCRLPTRIFKSSTRKIWSRSTSWWPRPRIPNRIRIATLPTF